MKYMNFFTVSVIDSNSSCYPGFMITRDGMSLADSLMPIKVAQDCRRPAIVDDKVMQGFVLVHTTMKKFNASGCHILKLPDASISTEIFVHLYVDSNAPVKILTNNHGVPRLHEVEQIGSSRKRESMIIQLKPNEYFQIENGKSVHVYRNLGGTLDMSVKDTDRERVTFLPHKPSFSSRYEPPSSTPRPRGIQIVGSR